MAELQRNLETVGRILDELGSSHCSRQGDFLGARAKGWGCEGAHPLHLGVFAPPFGSMDWLCSSKQLSRSRHVPTGAEPGEGRRASLHLGWDGQVIVPTTYTVAYTTHSCTSTRKSSHARAGLVLTWHALLVRAREPGVTGGGEALNGPVHSAAPLVQNVAAMQAKRGPAVLPLSSL